MNSVYIHIPFCASICSYCDFSKLYYNSSFVEKYLNALEKEIKENYKGEIIKTLYIGGGTPSSLNINELKKLFNIIKIFKLSDNIEFTIEVNPENIDEQKLNLFKSNKVNRISMGIESINEKQIKYLNRHHTKDEVKEKYNLIKKYFNNINLDLIYAIPNETIKILEEDINFIISLNPTHISTYSLMINDNTILGIKKEKNISEDLDYEMYNYIINKLEKYNYNHYEISNFSKCGYESIHNKVYWENKEYYGFGLSASGYIKNTRYDNTKSFTNYVNGNYKLSCEELNKSDIISYGLILGLRLTKGININEFNEKYNTNLLELYNIKDLIKQGLLITESGYIKIPKDKLYIENSILINFV